MERLLDSEIATLPNKDDQHNVLRMETEKRNYNAILHAWVAVDRLANDGVLVRQALQPPQQQYVYADSRTILYTCISIIL